MYMQKTYNPRKVRLSKLVEIIIYFQSKQWNQLNMPLTYICKLFQMCQCDIFYWLITFQSFVYNSILDETIHQ